MLRDTPDSSNEDVSSAPGGDSIGGTLPLIAE